MPSPDARTRTQRVRSAAGPLQHGKAQAMLQKACGRRPHLCIPDNPAKLLLHLAPSDVVGILRWWLQGKLECFSRANRVAAIRTERRWHLASQQHDSE